MKYVIEDGNVTMPVSELNRLNDISEELEKHESLLIKEREDIDKMIEDELICIVDNGHYPSFGRVPIVSRYRISDNKGSLKYKERIEKESQERAIYKSEKKFREMSVKEFKAWKKG